MGKVVALRRILLGPIVPAVAVLSKECKLVFLSSVQYEVFLHSESFANFITLATQKLFGFYSGILQKKFEKLFILPKEKALATFDLIMLSTVYCQSACSIVASC